MTIPRPGGPHPDLDGWTPPADDPLFGGSRTYSFSPKPTSLRITPPDTTQPDTTAPNTTPLGITPSPTTTSLGTEPAGTGAASVPQPGPTRYERPASRPRDSGTPAYPGVSPGTDAVTGGPTRIGETGESHPPAAADGGFGDGDPVDIHSIDDDPINGSAPSATAASSARGAYPSRWGRSTQDQAGGRGVHDARRLLAGVAGAVLVLVAAVAVVAVRSGHNGHNGHNGHETPTTRQTLPPIPAGFLNSATLDSDPVTADEFFSDEQVEAEGRNYRRLARKLDNGCPDLTGGLVTQLKDRRCRQVVRTLFLSTPGDGGRQVLAGVTVFVLDELTTATATADILNQGRGGIVPLPVPANSIPNARITGPGGNNSWRGAITRGHYLIYTQVAYTDGAQGAGTDPALRNAQTDLSTLATEPIGDRAVLGHGPRH
ncbi:hypothetical protein [Frankia sp. CcWB3]